MARKSCTLHLLPGRKTERKGDRGLGEWEEKGRNKQKAGERALRGEGGATEKPKRVTLFSLRP